MYNKCVYFSEGYIGIMKKFSLYDYFRTVTFFSLAPLVVIGGFILYSVAQFGTIPSLSLDFFTYVPEIISSVFASVVLFLAFSLMISLYVRRRVNDGHDNRKK